MRYRKALQEERKETELKHSLRWNRKEIGQQWRMEESKLKYGVMSIGDLEEVGEKRKRVRFIDDWSRR